ncbi:MAG: hypothetical protein IKO68_00255 [Oscillospiraceae bacterium]|nr:hypothetical protein [Oscillospiraceae bacterium]MBR4655025.1 hypothetical protein [Oscillospiraceae bacterium]
MNFTLSGTNKELLVNDFGVYITEKEVTTFIPLRSIEAVVIKTPGTLSTGYILFRTPGSFVGSHTVKSTDAEVAMDRQAVLFKKGSIETALAIRDAIAAKLAI